LPPIVSPTKTSSTAERGLADECVAAGLVALLRADGHDVVYVAETAAGLSDADVITLASREARVLLTEDKDFDDLVFRRERAVPGVVLMRLAPENLAQKAVRLAAVIERYGEGLFGRYVVIEEGRFRSRRLWA
jgi:predicted nuclease of predicted toxin-antitoxin system